MAPSGRYFVRLRTMKPEVWEDDPQAVAKADQLVRQIELATGIHTGQVVLAADSTSTATISSLIARFDDPSASTAVNDRA